MSIKPITVSRINAYIRNMFSQDFVLRTVYVQGEVSNCKYHSSGHIYFTIKDSGGTLSCIMFATKRSGLDFQLREGQQVIVGGSIEVYERDGKYQLYASKILLDGIGSLYEKFDALKRELEESGMFDAGYKKAIPAFPKRVGIVTAPTGAAVRDIINVASRRNPYVQLILYPAIVQGDAAAQSIIRGIKQLASQNVDVIIVGRGGGSIEDLWAFNEREVAEAVFDSAVPVISAVGHETDTTIIDFVSDLRAPTPSAAAELAVPDVRGIEVRLANIQERLNMSIMRQIRSNRVAVEARLHRIKALSPNNRLENNKLRLDKIKLRLISLMNAQINESRMYITGSEDSVLKLFEKKLNDRKQKFLLLTEKLRGLSPLDKLTQGYSYVSDNNGKTVSSIHNVNPGDRLSIYVRDGKITATVKETYGDSQ